MTGSTPSRLVVRRGPDELVIASRRGVGVKWEKLLGAALVIAAVGIWGFDVPREWLVYGGLVVAGTFGWRLAKFWSHTTLRLSGTECWVNDRRLFATSHLHGTLGSLDIVGIAEMNPTTRADNVRETPIYCLHLSLSGSRAMVFRGAPRVDLEWLMAEVREWRGSHVPW